MTSTKFNPPTHILKHTSVNGNSMYCNQAETESMSLVMSVNEYLIFGRNDDEFICEQCEKFFRKSKGEETWDDY